MSGLAYDLWLESLTDDQLAAECLAAVRRELYGNRVLNGPADRCWFECKRRGRTDLWYAARRQALAERAEAAQGLMVTDTTHSQE